MGIDDELRAQCYVATLFQRKAAIEEAPSNRSLAIHTLRLALKLAEEGCVAFDVFFFFCSYKPVGCSGGKVGAEWWFYFTLELAKLEWENESTFKELDNAQSRAEAASLPHYSVGANLTRWCQPLLTDPRPPTTRLSSLW